MFTGIIRMLAPAVRATRTGPGARIAVDLGGLSDALAPGDSVSVSGVCLTVAAKSGTVCEFDAVGETLSRTTLGELRPGQRVNVEPSLRIGDQLGGHFVLGHVDGVGTIESKRVTGSEATMRVSVPPALGAQVVPKGCVAVDGVSLTVVDVETGAFTVALIPTTLGETTLGVKAAGEKVNIETDILGKLVARYLAAPGQPGGLTLEKLRDAGFA